MLEFLNDYISFQDKAMSEFLKDYISLQDKAMLEFLSKGIYIMTVIHDCQTPTVAIA